MSFNCIYIQNSLITGLDPAGMRFIIGSSIETKRIEAFPELMIEKLSRHSASFVDIIHTDGGLIPCIVFCPVVSNITLKTFFSFSILREVCQILKIG